ncbi:hypothetical protein [Aliirhizobium smilacinae]|uniref:Uncharacterized protein n=1 Tax=Aliirhizobium smilacinae TaxID=1395944 RepID=A0A5C4X9U8_9HYPH|nr:hypothetical protein [Rhizobium smilacinae]TNM60253.1 hypothetical protein FHP24_25950 [Rhizobium smilacinae]
MLRRTRDRRSSQEVKEINCKDEAKPLEGALRQGTAYLQATSISRLKHDHAGRHQAWRCFVKVQQLIVEAGG